MRVVLVRFWCVFLCFGFLANSVLAKDNDQMLQLKHLNQTLNQQVTELQAQLEAKDLQLLAVQNKINAQSQLPSSFWLVLVTLFLMTGTSGVFWLRLRKQKQAQSVGAFVEKHFPVKNSLTEESSNDCLIVAKKAIVEERFFDAKDVLEKGIHRDPTNIELRMALLEVFANRDDEVSFNSESNYLVANLIEENDQYWRKIAALYFKYWGTNMKRPS